MKYNFDEIVERRGTHCVKWDESPSDDVIPLWVADMDFKAAPQILEAVKKRAEHGVFGYTVVEEDYYVAVINWFRRRHNWRIHREEILYTTGVVPAMSVAIKALTMPGEKVLILSPDYNCFFSSITSLIRGYEGTGARGLENSLEAESNLVPPHLRTTVPPTFSIDWDDFEAKCSDEKTTVFLLCNPHNPTGRVWTKEELERMNDICLKHNVKVVSDEIHCELMMPGHTFQPFAAVSEACRKNSVILNSPSKSFNIAGLQIANIIVSNPSWRRRIDRAININEVCDVNPFGPVALIAAYNESEDWIDELNQYLWGNYTVLCDFIGKNMPQWKVCPLEGTYLPWVDVSAMGIPVDELCDRLLREAKVWINPGTMYGRESGKGYVRFNIATQRSRLVEALERIKVSFSPPE